MDDRRIEILVFDGCPNLDEVVDRAYAASKGTGVTVSIGVTLVRSEEEALHLRFLGSPTVRVDGNDVDPTALTRDDFGMQCRIYAVDGRFEGAPPVDWIAAALRHQARCP